VQVAISLAGFCVNNFSARFFQGNGIVPSSLGALTIGVLANLYSRLGRYCQNYLLDIWEYTIEPRLHRVRGKLRQPRHSPYHNCPPAGDSDETLPHPANSKEDEDIELGRRPSAGARARQIGYGLAAAAMLPAIFVQVPSGLAASGSLLSGITSADQIVRNETILANGTIVNGSTAAAAALPLSSSSSSSSPSVLTTTTTNASTSGADLSNSAFSVLFSVVQVAINISVGLSLSALLVYPFGKRRSGLFSF
jgi:uncharacterized membrane protein YjjB (DUF3815 family)